MPSYGVSSTIFGSIRIIRTSSGVARDSSETSIEFTKLDLPEPVEPATSRCGILARLADDEVALDVLAQPDHQRVVVACGSTARRSTSAEPDHLAVGVGHLDADRRLAGDRREQPDVVGGHRVGDVAGQRGDLLDLDAGPELDLVAGDRRAAGEAGDGRVDLELVEHLGDRLDHRVVGGAALLRRVARDQQAGGGSV